MMTSAVAQTAIRFVPPTAATSAPARAAPSVTIPVHRVAHRRPISAALVITRAREVATTHVLRSARRAVAVVVPTTAQGTARPLVPTAARLRRNRAAADAGRIVPAAVTTPVLPAVAEDVQRRVAVRAALIA